MPDVLDILATPRPEGGAVRLTFGLTSDTATAYVQRVPTGDPAPTHGDPAIHVVFDGAPVQVDDDYRFRRAATEPQAALELAKDRIPTLIAAGELYIP